MALPIASRRRSVVLALACAFAATAATASPAQAASLVADFRLQNTLQSSTPNGPTLQDTGTPGSAFATETVNGAPRTVYQFPEGAGVAFDSAGLVPRNDFSLVVLFNFDATAGYRRIIDLRIQSTDRGLYALNSALNYYPVVTGTANTIVPDDYVQVTLVRNALAGTVTGYVDGVQQFSFTADGSGADDISAADVLNFFRDDLAVPNEDSPGAVARIRAYAGALTPAEVAALDELPSTGDPCSQPGVISGTPGPDTIPGTAGDDVICAGDGADVVRGGGGNDTIYGEGGNDTLLGESGRNRLFGDGGADILGAGVENDDLHGGTGVDRASYADRTAAVTASLVADQPPVDGSAFSTGNGEAGESDRLFEDLEDVNGGAGDDTLTGDDGSNTLRGNGGGDALAGGDGPDVLRAAPAGGSGVETLSGGAGDDLLEDGPGNGTVDGGPGLDRMIAGLGDDAMTGGADTDVIDYTTRAVGVVVNLAGTPGGGQAGESDLVSGFEQVVTGPGADTVNGTSAAEVISGNGGSDILNGGGGLDSLLGSGGNDQLDVRDTPPSGDPAPDCGSGSDTVRIDAADGVRGNCETRLLS